MGKWSWMFCVVISAVMCGSAAFAEEPAATFSFESTSVALGVGRSSGNGTLNYDGETYRFSITGLSLIDVGISKINAEGEVYNLNNLEDFSGTYMALEAGGALVKGGSGTVMKNSKGVLINLKSKQDGLKLTFGPQGMNIILKDKVSKPLR